MAEYQKYMFDNFVVKDDSKKSAAKVVGLEPTVEIDAPNTEVVDSPEVVSSESIQENESQHFVNQ